MTYSLRGIYIHRKHSADQHLPRQPRQLSWVRLTVSKSCMSKIRPREGRSPSPQKPFKTGVVRRPAGTDGSGVRLVGKPLAGSLSRNSQGNRDLVP